MSGALVRRLHKKLDAAGFATMTLKDAKAIERAFVEALKEEVDQRYGGAGYPDCPMPLRYNPLRIPGLGSFKVRTRKGGLQFRVPGQSGFTAPKPPARRLVFTSKWEALP